MIPVAKPLLGEEEAAAARDAILSGWVAQGPRVKQFEESFAAYVGAAHACAVSSCTTALHLALLGVGVRPGDLVITVSHSFIATANSIRHCGAEPLFVDIDPATYNMDTEQLQRMLAEDCVQGKDGIYYRDVQRLRRDESPLCGCSNADNPGRIAAVLPVHQMGLPCDIRKIVAIAKQHALPVVEDAACAIGSAIANENGSGREQIGRPHGDVACFSFHPRKVLTTGEGGMLTTCNPQLDQKLRLLRQHAMSIPDTVRHAASQVIIEEYISTGYNYRMTDIQAAVGMVQLGRLDAMLRERRQLARVYHQHLSDIDNISLIEPGHGANHNWQSFPVRISNGNWNIVQNI
ncbi:MAG: DegT/DnrJ/EryC1/StrS family aminotransferase, partial [Desulfobulbaceae bacterium]